MSSITIIYIRFCGKYISQWVCVSPFVSHSLPLLSLIHTHEHLL